MHQHTNDEQATQCCSKHLVIFVLHQHAKALGDLLANISH